jgi:hypothetical protein
MAGIAKQQATSTASADFLLILCLQILCVGLSRMNEATGNPFRRGGVSGMAAPNPGRCRKKMEG